MTFESAADAYQRFLEKKFFAVAGTRRKSVEATAENCQNALGMATCLLSFLGDGLPVAKSFARCNLCVLFVLCSFVFLGSVAAKAQEPSQDTVGIRTRVVSIDTLVLDKNTGSPIADLARENFEVLADGKRRTLSYFRHGSDDRRRPLAIMLVIDLVPGGAQNSLRRPEILTSLAVAVKKLSPEDEVALFATLGGVGGPLKTLTDFTRDRAKVAAVLASIPALPPPEPRWYSEELQNVILNVERAALQRPNSQVVVVPVTTDFGQISYSKRDEMAARLIRANALFSPLIRDPGRGSVRMANVPGKYPTPPRSVFTAIGALTGTDMYAPAHLADETGGEASRVQDPEEYGAGLERMIKGLSTRYDLGFALDQTDRDDGRMHKLEVRVKTRDAKGKQRKVIIRARRGYYVPKTDEMAK